MLNSSSITAPLFALTRSGLRGQPVSGEQRTEIERASWTDLCDLAKRHDLLPLLDAGAAASGIQPPADVGANLRKSRRVAEMRSDQAWDQLTRIGQAFRAQGVRLILLKGVHLATRCYPTPGLRPFGDLDILVPPAQRDQAAAILKELGYATGEIRNAQRQGFDYHYHWSFLAERRFPVELHWFLTAPGSAVQFDYEPLWERAAPEDSPCGPVSVMSPEDEFLFLAVHLARHHLAVPLRNQIDLAAFLRRNTDLDWDCLWQRAAAAGAARDLALALGTACALGLITLPDETLSRVGAADPPLDFPLLARYAVEWPNAELPRVWVDVLTAPSWRAGVRCLRKTLLPDYETLYDEHLSHAVGQPGAPTGAAAAIYFHRWLAHARAWGGKLAQLPRNSRALRTAVQVRRQVAHRP